MWIHPWRSSISKCFPTFCHATLTLMPFESSRGSATMKSCARTTSVSSVSKSCKSGPSGLKSTARTKYNSANPKLADMSEVMYGIWSNLLLTQAVSRSASKRNVVANHGRSNRCSPSLRLKLHGSLENIRICMHEVVRHSYRNARRDNVFLILYWYIGNSCLSG